MNDVQLLMIHGLLGSIDYFAPRRYLEGITLHTPDQLGYGAQADAAPADIDLQRQADRIARIVADDIGKPTWLLGHSVGGAVAMLVAARVPELITGLISVEGNFTLNDAFWCARIAATARSEWDQQYRVMAADPQGLLARGEIASTPERLAMAAAILANQPAATVHGMARSVIAHTGDPGYLALVRDVVARTPLYLIAGERSAAGWDVPAWARAAARGSTVLAGTGHMMMLEDPAGFCASIRAIVAPAGA